MKPPQRPRKRSYFTRPARTSGKALQLLGVFVVLALWAVFVFGLFLVPVHFIIKYW